jgi:hypothetical protein
VLLFDIVEATVVFSVLLLEIRDAFAVQRGVKLAFATHGCNIRGGYSELFQRNVQQHHAVGALIALPRGPSFDLRFFRQQLRHKRLDDMHLG